MLTLLEVAERLKRFDEVTILEVLNISTEEIIDRFMDKLEDKYEELVDDLEDDLNGD